MDPSFRMSVQNMLSEESESVHTETCCHQNQVRELYETPETQFTVAFLIFLNFVAEAIGAQMLPEDGSDEAYIFLIFEFIFNISFTIELVWNMYGSWFFRFWDSGWNWFDFIIVIVSLLAMMFPALPGISVLRLFRAFRVFRLFKRVKSLKKIIEGVLGALPGVSQAFLVLGILMGIWSVIGVQFFADRMPQFFGDFMKAMFTLFQIMTMDSWSSGIARQIIFDEGLPLAAIFFISYIFIAGIVMTNVVVAILLDKYLEAIDNDKKEEEKSKKKMENAARAEREARDKSKALEIYVYKDGRMSPLRKITWKKYRQLEKLLQEPIEDVISDQENGSEPTTDISQKNGEGKSNASFKPVVFKWSVDQVLQWLSSIGFDEFYKKFRHEEIDGRTLTQLNDVDLIGLGMKLQRRKDFMVALYELLDKADWPENTKEKSEKYIKDQTAALKTENRRQPRTSNNHPRTVARNIELARNLQE